MPGVENSLILKVWKVKN